MTRRQKVRRTVEPTCPDCGATVPASGCFDGEPTDAALAGLTDIALAMHRKLGGCTGSPPAGNVPRHDDQTPPDR